MSSQNLNVKHLNSCKGANKSNLKQAMSRGSKVQTKGNETTSDNLVVGIEMGSEVNKGSWSKT